MAISIKHLSEACGVSPSTVSKALNGYADISEDTRLRVQTAAEKLGYRPSPIARALKTGRTYNIGVVYNEKSGSGFTHSFFAPVLESLKSEAESHGYDISFITPHSKALGMSYLTHSLYRKVDAVCVLCCDFEDAEVRQLSRSSLPLVTIDEVLEGRCCVMSQNEEGMAELTRHVISLGHRDIAYVHGLLPAVASVQRLKGFHAAMAGAGIPVNPGWIKPSSYHRPNETREAVRELLKSPKRPTCILLPDDYAALGGLEAAAAEGLRVPEDISMAGFDGVSILQMCRPQMTTVAQDCEGIGRLAAQSLVDQIENPQGSRPLLVHVPARLIKGQTVCAITGA
ncbi:MAG: LacI family DNA-binding transcriptional regulator [Eubacteriales bacterium]|nr:LacI family DNA-binding transcriptional regulator [Eubacteriales bacterium]NLO12637.1 LacI family transcriptional regulator [Clostridiales bacterium]